MVSQNVAEIIKNHVTLEAQEKAAVFRTIHKRNAETGKAYPWISRG